MATNTKDKAETAKNYQWAADNLARMAAEETDPELRCLWLRAAAIGREKAKAGPPQETLPAGE